MLKGVTFPLSQLRSKNTESKIYRLVSRNCSAFESFLSVTVFY